MDMNLSELGRWWWAGKPGMLQSMGSQRVRHKWVTEQFQGISSLRNRTCISCSNCICMWFLYHWTIKKAEHQRFDAFWLWCWRRLLRVPWRARRSNQLILKEINSEYSWKDWCWSWNSSTLATSREELTHCKKNLMLEQIEGKRRRGRQRMRWLDSIATSMGMYLSKL